MSEEKGPKRFDPVLRAELMDGFTRLEELKVLPKRDLRAIYSSRPTETVRPAPQPTVRQLNTRFSNS